MRLNYEYMLSSIFVVMMLCAAQIIGSNILILICLFTFLILIGIACAKNFTLPLLLFFLPWSQLMRTSQQSFSFYTFGLVLICFVSILKKRFSFKRYHIVCGIVLTFLTLLSKVIDGSWIALDYIAFIMLFFVFPVVKEEYKAKKYDFFDTALFFSVGVILGALCAVWFADFPNISKYITVHSYLVIKRMCGFYGDPNFYCAQITAAMGGCLYTISNEKAKYKTALLGICFAVLIYCGLMSGSKSFIIVTFSMIFVWLVELFRTSGKGGRKTILIICGILFAVYITSSAIFTGWIEIVLTRFSFSKNLSDFTTGRTELWLIYIKEIFGKGKILFLGKGITNVKISNAPPHNTILQIMFQLGLTGLVVLAGWIFCFFKGTFCNIKRNNNVVGIWSLIVGCFLPWMAIDILFFDEFFLFQWFLFTALLQNQIYAEQSIRKTDGVNRQKQRIYKNRIKITWN